jgi:hypothetical protein
MTASRSENVPQTWIDLGIVTGILAGVFYGLPQIPSVPWRIHDFAFMGFGPLLSVAAVGLYCFFRRNRETVSNQIAHLFLFVAGLSFTYMATMQMSIYKMIPRYYLASADAEREFWRNTLKAVSSTQLGLDFAFDIFVSVATVLIGLQMVRHPHYWSWFGILGMLVGVTGLTFNFITFPDNSGEAGLVDPGPFFGVWMSLSVIPVWRFRRWTPGEEGR